MVVIAAPILPIFDGEGTHPQGGGGVAALDFESLERTTSMSTPFTPPPCFAWSPSPPLRGREDKNEQAQ
ncbi:MAG: hypothetical protein JWP15_277 [Alphaproteobacteria bacterium]|nr:hypothetical protein [Alphaproteobacteria bacterium]